MNKTKVILISFLVLVTTISLGVVSKGVALYNTEIKLRNQITAKQLENTSNFDNMWKKIKQSANVADKYKDGLKEVLEVYTTGRSDKSENMLMKWGAEAVPNFDSSIYKQLNNIIVASRDDFTLNQKQLIDLKREHDSLLTTFPNVIYFRLMGTEKVNISVVTSTKTNDAFSAGVDDEVDL